MIDRIIVVIGIILLVGTMVLGFGTLILGALFGDQ